MDDFYIFFFSFFFNLYLVPVLCHSGSTCSSLAASVESLTSTVRLASLLSGDVFPAKQQTCENISSRNLPVQASCRGNNQASQSWVLSHKIFRSHTMCSISTFSPLCRHHFFILSKNSSCIVLLSELPRIDDAFADFYFYITCPLLFTGKTHLIAVWALCAEIIFFVFVFLLLIFSKKLD